MLQTYLFEFHSFSFLSSSRNIFDENKKPMVNIDVAHFPALRNDISLLQYMQMQAQYVIVLSSFFSSIPFSVT